MVRVMKDSGIEWIGEIPENWDFDRGKYHFTNNKYVVGVKSVDYDRLALTMDGVILHYPLCFYGLHHPL